MTITFDGIINDSGTFTPTTYLAALASVEAREEREAIQWVEASRHAWRCDLSTWPDPWRQRWGELAASLELSGTAWPDSEREAFAAIAAEKVLGGPAYAVEVQPVAIVAKPGRVRQTSLIGA